MGSEAKVAQRPNQIFVAKIPTTADNVDLKALFTFFGEVTKVYVPKNPQGLRRTYGFVTFRTSEAAENAIKHSNLFLHGSKLFVNWAREKSRPSVDAGVFFRQLDEPSTSKVEAHSIFNDDEDEDSMKCKITILNEDCMRHIFSFLSKKDWLKIERVCKWWQSVCWECWSGVKNLSIQDVLPNRFVDKPASEILLKSILARCGEYLTILSLNARHPAMPVPVAFSLSTITKIVDSCPVLQRLEMGVVPLRLDSKNQLTNLTELVINSCNGYDREVGKIFKALPNIRSLHISNCGFYMKHCLKSLNTNTLEELFINNCQNIIIKHLLPSFRQMQNLKSLTVIPSDEYIITHEDFIQVVKCLPNLESLTVPNCKDDLTASVAPLGTLTNLISLDVNRNSFIDDAAVKGIAANCLNLESLNITGTGIFINENSSVTDVGVKALAKLPRLNNLWLSYLRFVTDDGLSALAFEGRLRKLEIRGNSKITDVACSKVVSFCQNLEHLDLSGCNLITDSTVTSAEAAVKARTNNKRLELIVGGTLVSDPDKWKDSTPLLSLISKDFSELLYMNDFNLAHAFLLDVSDDDWYLDDDYDSDVPSDDLDFLDGEYQVTWDDCYEFFERDSDDDDVYLLSGM